MKSKTLINRAHGNLSSNPKIKERKDHNHSQEHKISTLINEEYSADYEKHGYDFHKDFMHVDFFSGTFYALQTKYKKKYKLLTSDQADYLFECFFLIAVQVLLCILILIYDSNSVAFHNNFELNLCSFFTSLVMHFSCIATIRNGMDMCKFVVYHSKEFNNPKMAFSLGMLIILANMFCAFTNAV